MLTRRVHGRVFLLRPSKRTNQIIDYVVAVMADKWQVQVCAITVMSNHWHVCLYDPHGHVVEFQHDCHQFIARAINAAHGDFESLWTGSEPTSRVECEEPDDFVARIAYTLANPVEAGLVRHGHSWPGVRWAWPRKPRVVKRPHKFFRSEKVGGRWPEQAILRASRPPGYDELSDDELAAVIAGAVEAREEEFRRQYDKEGRPFLGRRAVLRQSRYDRPGTREPRFTLSPQVACRNKWRRIERLRANRDWRDRYRAALRRWRAGERDVEFPEGTYKMYVVHAVRRAKPPD